MTARALSLGWLLIVWIALWETVSIANVVSGIVVGVALLTLFPTADRSRHPARLRPVAALRFLGYFLWKLVEANVVVAWEVLTPNNESVNEGIVAVAINGSSDAVVAVVANAISLTPGTLTLDVERDPTVLYVHVLHLRTISQTRLDVLHLQRYVLAAIGTDDAVADVDRRIAAEEQAQHGRTPTGEAP